MTDDTKIRAAWEAYHGKPWPGSYLPAIPPAYSRGYRDGRASLADEIRQAVDDLEVSVYAPEKSSISVLHACNQVRQAVGYGKAESHAPAVIEILKQQITLLRIELADALMMAYGARANWPESARKALKEGEE